MTNQMLVKETREIFKSYKALIIPLVFIAILLMQPIVLKMLPDILANNSSLPEGAVIQMPDPTVVDVMGSILGQFEQLGIITIVLIMMGTIVEERASGVSAMVLVKPIGREKYYFTKLIMYTLLVVVSFILAMAFCGYYTDIMYSGFNWGNLFKGAAVYLPNLLLVISIVLFFSSFFKKQLTVAAGTIVLYNVLGIVPKYLGDSISSIAPSAVVSCANKVLAGMPDVESLKPVICVSILAVLFILAGWIIFKKQEI